METRLGLAAMFMRDLGITGGTQTKKARISEALNTADLLIAMELKTRGRDVDLTETDGDLVGLDPEDEPLIEEELVEPVKQAPTNSRTETEGFNLRDLGVSGHACAPLSRMGVDTLYQVAVQSRDDIKDVKGVSRDAIKHLDDLLEQHGLTWGMMAPIEAEDEDLAEGEEDDLL